MVDARRSAAASALLARMGEQGIAWSAECGICTRPALGVFTTERYWKDKGGHVRTTTVTGPLCGDHLEAARSREGRKAFRACKKSPIPAADTPGYDCCLLCPPPRIMSRR